MAESKTVIKLPSVAKKSDEVDLEHLRTAIDYIDQRSVSGGPIHQASKAIIEVLEYYADQYYSYKDKYFKILAKLPKLDKTITDELLAPVNAKFETARVVDTRLKVVRTGLSDVEILLNRDDIDIAVLRDKLKLKVTSMQKIISNEDRQI